MSPAEVTAYLHDDLPLTAAMQLRAEQADAQAVRLFAPLGPNLNHRQTAFGGSIATLAITAGWTYVHLRMLAEGYTSRLVIRNSNVEFHTAISGDLIAECTAPAEEVWANFIRAYIRRGQARLQVQVDVRDARHPDQTAATLIAEYVALPLPADKS